MDMRPRVASSFRASPGDFSSSTGDLICDELRCPHLLCLQVIVIFCSRVVLIRIRIILEAVVPAFLTFEMAQNSLIYHMRHMLGGNHVDAIFEQTLRDGFGNLRELVAYAGLRSLVKFILKSLEVAKEASEKIGDFT